MNDVNPITPHFRALEETFVLQSHHGVLRVARHGGQILSWVPKGHIDVFWCSGTPMPEQAAKRGGVPICWPWFAKQNVPDSSPQHGLVRTMPWRVIAEATFANADAVQLALEPDWTSLSPDQIAQCEAALGIPLRQLDLRQDIILTDRLQQTLTTTNRSNRAIALTQAFHSYFAVSDPAQVELTGVANLPYLDKLQNFKLCQESQAFRFESACDRIYYNSHGSYTLSDALLQRMLSIDSMGSSSVVVWNPGPTAGSAMVDVGAEQSRRFFCVEVSNAAPDVILLHPGTCHALGQTLEIHSI
jgi:glucose-6-phosphate 1-epimerase